MERPPGPAHFPQSCVKLSCSPGLNRWRDLQSEAISCPMHTWTDSTISPSVLVTHFHLALVPSFPPVFCQRPIPTHTRSSNRLPQCSSLRDMIHRPQVGGSRICFPCFSPADVSLVPCSSRSPLERSLLTDGTQREGDQMRKVASHLFYTILCLLEIDIIGDLKILPSPVKTPKLEYLTRNDVFQTQPAEHRVSSCFMPSSQPRRGK